MYSPGSPGGFIGKPKSGTRHASQQSSLSLLFPSFSSSVPAVKSVKAGYDSRLWWLVHIIWDFVLTFGLYPESVADDPWKLLISVTLLNKTSGKLAIPVFWDILNKWPTPLALSQGVMVTC